MNLGSSITTMAADLTNWLKDLWDSSTAFFASMVKFCTDLWTLLTDWTTKTFVPEKDFISPLLNKKLGFIAQFQSVVNQFSSPQTAVFSYSISFFGKSWKIVDLGFYEPYRLMIRDLIAAVFYGMFFISCYRLLVGLFGVGVSSGTSIDHDKTHKSRLKGE